MSEEVSKQADENIAAREKGLIIAREFDRVVRTFNKVLLYKENCAKSLGEELQGLAKTLQENLNSQNAINRNLEIYDSNSEKILVNLQHLESEERSYISRYERLLRGIGIDGENQEAETSSDQEDMHGQEDTDVVDLDNLEKLRTRRDTFLQSLNQEFKNLEEKLASIEKLRNELGDSRDELKEKKALALEQKETLEEQGKKLLNDVVRLESELETTILEEKNLIEESTKMIKQVENSLELDESIDHVLFSSLSLSESSEIPSNIEPNGQER